MNKQKIINLMRKWNDTYRNYSSNSCLHHIFENQVVKYPELPVLQYLDQKLTYSELNQKANYIAHQLIKEGVGPDTIVGICIERSLEMVIGLLAILKAGGAYLPLDPDYPQNRIDFIVKDANLKLILTNNRNYSCIQSSSVCIINLDNEENYTETEGKNPDTEVKYDHLAYIIYTSGSSGEPKGVMVEHKAIVNRLIWMQEMFLITKKDCVLQKTPYSFDVSVWEFFWPLLFGAKLVMAKPGGHKDPNYLLDVIKDEKITIIHFVPSMLRLFLQTRELNKTASLRLTICSGEALPLDLEKKYFKKMSAKLYNLYGPTEAAVDVTYWECQKNLNLGLVPIGRPIANIQLYILNQKMQPVAIGEKGELYIAGVGLARGYLNRQDLTNEKFISIPVDGPEKKRLYKTGDICRYLPDGVIEYLHRVDYQIKLRGFRIELGEIEVALRENDSVNEGIVTTYEDVPGDIRIIAYITVDKKDFSLPHLFENLEKKLPEYMIPSSIVTVDKYPLTPNGKIDRKALPKPVKKRPELQQSYVAAKTNTEKQIETVWCKILGLDCIGVYDNFFDLGGNSFLAVQFVNILDEEYGIKIPVLKMFEFPSIKTLSAHINNKELDENVTIKKDELDDSNDMEHQIEDESLDNAIAIIGMSGRFPGAPDLDTLWSNLCAGKESVSHYTMQELIDAGIAPELLDNPNYIRSAPIIEGADTFDASFFGFSSEDASRMEPQHRLFLEYCWNSLEDAGYNPDDYSGRIGVFGGCSMNYYLLKNVLPTVGFDKPLESFLTMIGNEKDYISTRVSYCLNLTGPSINLQTGCSTALVGVHLACQSLLNFDCDMALAGSATVKIPQKEGYLYQEGMILSKDGHCRTFDEKASGTLFGEGVGVVLLKRYQDAVKDKDTIDAVILGSAINNDGSLKVGYTAPSVKGQQDVIESAHVMAEIEPKNISYIETHGTGTQLGDPIEVKALAEVFGDGTQKYCALGAIKPNIGHLDAAAGIAGLIKTVLVLKNRKIPPVINFNNINPKLELEKTPFYINTECVELTSTPFNENKDQILAGVSSFGVGGTNAHVVLQAEKKTMDEVPKKALRILPCSAKSSDALNGNILNLKSYLQLYKDVDINNLAYTLQKGRKHFQYREIVVAETGKEAYEQLQTLQSVGGKKRSLTNPSITFMFTGQGSQYVNMAKDLYEREPIFRNTLDKCTSMISSFIGTDFSSIIFTSGTPSQEMNERLARTEYTQPALFTIEYSLAKLYLHWGIKPDVMIGHSSGEYVAATLAGVFSLNQALEIICLRGQLMQKMPKGVMLAVELSADEVIQYCNNDISLAVVNSPTHSVVAGTISAITALDTKFKKMKLKTTILKTSHAFHSWMMAPAAEKFIEKLKTMQFNKPSIQIISNVTGDFITDEDAVSPQYWGNHISKTVCFSAGVQKLLNKREHVFIEVGPGSTLSSLVNIQVGDNETVFVIPSLPNFKMEKKTYKYFLRSVGQIWKSGVAINWSIIFGENSGRRIHLPTYAFERKRYWIEPDVVLHNSGNKIKTNRTKNNISKIKESKILNNKVKDITKILLSLWQNLLGVDEIVTTDNYFELGGTSLQALRLFEDIEKELGVSLPVGTLINAPTIEELTTIIKKNENHAANWSLIVPIRPNGTKKPLFLVHGGSGNVLLYRELAMCLPKDQPVYGIQAQGLNGTDPVLHSIEEMATTYVKEIQAVDPSGPYYLGGYCLGGTIIYEIAQQLVATGKKVALVAMFDTSREWFELTRPEKFRFLLDNIGFHAKNISQASAMGKVDFIKERGLEAVRRVNRKLKVFSSQILHKAGIRKEPPLIIMESINDAAAMKYIVKPYIGKITIFKPKSISDIVDPYLGWKSVKTGGVDLVNLSAYRNGILVSPFVKELAAELSKRLEK